MSAVGLKKLPAFQGTRGATNVLVKYGVQTRLLVGLEYQEVQGWRTRLNIGQDIAREGAVYVVIIHRCNGDL